MRILTNLKSKLLSIITVIAMLLTMTVSAFASDNPPYNSDAEVDVDISATIAMLFVWANLDDTTWNQTTNISSIIPLYNNDEEINGYCVNLVTNQNETGYIIISTDLYSSLIQEYSDTANFMNESEAIPATSLNTSQDFGSHIYYYGPLDYSTTKQNINGINQINNEENLAQENYDNNCNFINSLRETGLIPYSTNSNSVEISDPITYLEGKYSGKTFSNVGYSNIGDNSIYSYIISDNNACSVYGTAALLKYHLGSSYSFSSIVSRCKTIAVNEGYASNSNYYIKVGQLAPFANKCIEYYGLDLTASSSLLSWDSGTMEIMNKRPILLNIASSEQYNDHTVTAFAFTKFQINPGTKIIRFFKVKDGYVTGNRYVNFEEISISYITRMK